MLENKKALAVLVFLGICGVVLFFQTYQDIRPEATLQVNISKTEAAARADDILIAHGFAPAPYQKTVQLVYDDPVYLKKTFGIAYTNELIRNSVISCWKWRVRYFKELEKEGFLVSLKADTGRMVYFGHHQMDDAEAEDIDHARAQDLAETFFASQTTGDWQQVVDTEYKQKNRTDHIFEWEQKDPRIGEAARRVYVSVSGDRLEYFSEYLKVPESFRRGFFKEQIPSFIIHAFFWLINIFLFGAVIVSLFIQYKKKSLRTGAAKWLVFVYVVLNLLNLWNVLPMIWGGYDTQVSKFFFMGMSLGSHMIGICLGALGLFILFIVGESLARDIGHNAFPFFTAWKEKKLYSRKILHRIFIAYLLVSLRIGYVTSFFLLMVQFFDAWKPIASLYTHVFSWQMPFLMPLTFGLSTFLLEGLKFRLFTISFIMKYLKNIWIAVIFSACCATFISFSTTIQPVYLKALQMILLFAAWGWVYWKYGFEVVFWIEFLFGMFLVCIPLLRSTVPFFYLSGWIVTGILVLPALWALYGWQKIKDQKEA